MYSLRSTDIGNNEQRLVSLGSRTRRKATIPSLTRPQICRFDHPPEPLSLGTRALKISLA